MLSIPTLKTKKNRLEKQIDKLKEVDPEKLKREIERLQSENKTAKEKHEKDLSSLKISNAIEKALTGAKAKNLTAVKALLNMGEMTLDGDNGRRRAVALRLPYQLNSRNTRASRRFGNGF